jgi:hypothetical protein
MHLTRPRECRAGQACFDDLTGPGQLCLPAGATPTSVSMPSYPIASGCLDETTVEVLTHGYAYASRCGLQTQFRDGDTVSFQGVCVVDAGGRFTCQHPDDVETCSPGDVGRCDSATRGVQCVAQGDGRHLFAVQECSLPFEGAFGTSSAGTSCEMGACQRVGPCSGGEPLCLTGFLRSYCDGDTEYWAVEECAGGCDAGACAGS